MNQFIPAEFHGTPLSIIDRDGQKWLTAEEVGRCLGYDESNARKGVMKLYERHGDEFSEADTCVVNLTTQGQNRAMRIFSAEGCVLLAMFSNTPRAKDFRIWAKKALAAQAQPSTFPATALQFITESNRDMAREIGQLKDTLNTQNRAILSLYQQVDGARLGHLGALAKLLRMQERQHKLLIGQEKREARETILRLEAEGVPREIIAQRTGRTFNHIRQVVFQARRDGELPSAQGELGLGGA